MTSCSASKATPPSCGSEVRGSALHVRTGRGQTAQTGPGTTGQDQNPTISGGLKTVWRWATTESGTLGTTGTVAINFHSSVRKIRIKKKLLCNIIFFTQQNNLCKIKILLKNLLSVWDWTSREREGLIGS